MDATVCQGRKMRSLVFIGVGIRFRKREASAVDANTVAEDLAKSVFQLAVADSSWRIIETQRLNDVLVREAFLGRSSITLMTTFRTQVPIVSNDLATTNA